jgi:hypothetical protein
MARSSGRGRGMDCTIDTALTRKLVRLDENIGVAAVGLTADDLRRIDSSVSKITVQGARCPEPSMELHGCDFKYHVKLHN